jgi:hypothetical protein
MPAAKWLAGIILIGRRIYTGGIRIKRDVSNMSQTIRAEEKRILRVATWKSKDASPGSEGHDSQRGKLE